MTTFESNYRISYLDFPDVNDGDVFTESVTLDKYIDPVGFSGTLITKETAKYILEKLTKST